MANHPARLDRTFHALADPTRRGVLERLAAQGPATVTELAASSSIGLPTFLKHLRVLEGGGLITTVKSGRTRTCRLHGEDLSEAERWLAGRRVAVEGELDRFTTYAEALARGEGAAR